MIYVMKLSKEFTRTFSVLITEDVKVKIHYIFSKIPLSGRPHCFTLLCPSACPSVRLYLCQPAPFLRNHLLEFSDFLRHARVHSIVKNARNRIFRKISIWSYLDKIEQKYPKEKVYLLKVNNTLEQDVK